jgi:hypothetical protein
MQAEARDQVHALETKIRSGANWTYDEGRKGVCYLGTQIEYLGSQMQKFGGLTDGGQRWPMRRGWVHICFSRPKPIQTMRYGRRPFLLVRISRRRRKQLQPLPGTVSAVNSGRSFYGFLKRLIGCALDDSLARAPLVSKIRLAAIERLVAHKVIGTVSPRALSVPPR